MGRSKWLVLLAAAATIAHAGGPRWYTGLPFYTVPPGQPVAFFTPDVRYYTDPGSLSANVSHAQADAMVAAAAAVWNVQPARLTLKQGGMLNEHLSSANVYFDGQQMVFPADVQLANYHAKPIAVVYDTDGSVIDTLLGAGASAPSGCRTNGVVQEVDGLDPAGTIDHALVVLNGRCVGSAPEQMTQMQYQLMRAFGRVLGLAWSQLNDNIFTGSSTPTALQMANWPVMHPIDVICGTYTYQCMQNPFSLRVDDLSALAMLYPVTAANIVPGKTLSQQGAATQFGWVRFPTGQGMDAVNVVLQRLLPFVQPENTMLLSAVTGANHHQYWGNAINGGEQGPVESGGEFWGQHEGYYFFQRVPIAGYWGWASLAMTTEPINPLYTGDYAIAGYVGQPPKMSGSSVSRGADGIVHLGDYVDTDLEQADAASNCNPAPAGTEAAPIAVDATGWWSGLFCGSTAASWLAQTVQPGRSWTLEVTALDETGAPSGRKLMPVMGVYQASDPLGAKPTVAAAAIPLNGRVVGLTQLNVAASSAQRSYRMLITDERGIVRPDFTYSARLLYAESVMPGQVGKSGGLITVSGEGFRTGNVVKVNGVNATVLSWTANQIVAIAPSMTVAGMSASGQADVSVVDPSTGGTATMQAAISYGGAGVDGIQLVTVPALKTGVVSATAFSVRVLLSDGVTPARGASVTFAASGAGAVFAVCRAASCTLVADANGVVQSMVLAASAGSLTLTATEVSGGASVQAVVAVTDPIRVVTTPSADHYVAPGTAGSWSVNIAAVQDGLAAVGLPVTWKGAAGLTLQNASSATGSDGQAAAAISTTGLAAGTTAGVQGCVWLTVCAGVRVIAVDPAGWSVHVESGAGQSVAAAKTLAPVVVQVTDAAGHPVESATVTVAQTVDAWQGACPATGRCPAVAVLTSSRRTFTTGTDGRLSITPVELPGVASTVNIAVIAGTNGFVSLSLLKTP